MTKQAAFDWAWKRTEVTGTTRIILMTIAEYVDASSTGEAFMSQSTLAAQAGITRRAVDSHLKALLKSGLITVDHGAGVNSGKGRPTDSYRVNMGRNLPYVIGQESAVSGIYGRNLHMTTSDSRSREVGETPSGFMAPGPSGTDAQTITVDYVQETDVPTPGFEEDAPAAPVKRGWVDDDADLAGVGRVRSRPVAETKAPKPLAKWNARDFAQDFQRRCRDAAPNVPEQIQMGWALGDFKKWLTQGVPPEVIAETVESFFAEPQNLYEVGKATTLWQRYRIWFVHRQGMATEKIQRKTSPVEGGAVINKAYLDFMED